MVQVSFDDSDSYIGKATGVEEAAPGNHAFVIVRSQPHVSREKRNINMCWSIRMLEDPDDPKSFVGPLINKYTALPIHNAEIEGHQAPERAGPDTCAALSLFYPEEVKAYPAWSTELNSFAYDGAPITREEQATFNYKAYLTGKAKAKELWGEDGQGLSDLEGYVFYAKLSFQHNFPVFGNMCTEPPPEWQQSDTFVINTVAPELREVEEPVPVPEKKTRGRRKR